MNSKHIGSRFEEWLNEEGIFDEVEAIATKKILARQIEQTMKEKNLTKSDLAKRMHTSRRALDRLLDPENVSVTLITLEKAAHVLEKKLVVELC